MQLTLSLNRRTHLFVRDGKLFFKLYKQSNFTDKKDFAVLSDVPIEQAEAIHKWLGEVIDATKKAIQSQSAPQNRISNITSIIYLFLQSQKKLSVTEVMDSLTIKTSRRTMQRLLKDMVDVGVIEGDKGNPQGFTLNDNWKFLPNSQPQETTHG